MQDIELNCPYCSRRFSVLGTLAGAEAICPGCAKPVRVPFESDPRPVQKPTQAESKVSDSKTSSRRGRKKPIGSIVAGIIGLALLAAAGTWYLQVMRNPAPEQGRPTSTAQPPKSAPAVEPVPMETVVTAPEEPGVSAEPIMAAVEQPEKPAEPIMAAVEQPEIPAQPVVAAVEQPTVPPAPPGSTEPAPPTEPSAKDLFIAAARKVAVQLNQKYPMIKLGEELNVTLVNGAILEGRLKDVTEEHIFIDRNGSEVKVTLSTLEKKSRLQVDRGYRKNTIKALAKKAVERH